MRLLKSSSNISRHKESLVNNMMIKMRKGYQYAITPTQQQAQKIEQNIGCARFI
ncbi:helix-turn-helix domain-containing protein, partial [[Eubacterium] hominis]|uniref:helix-turn-helix domain-containing protein n=1 Tax=[Eubacterium] hominis TaxID=2764325 RepID=UPI003A4C69B3